MHRRPFTQNEELAAASDHGEFKLVLTTARPARKDRTDANIRSAVAPIKPH